MIGRREFMQAVASAGAASALGLTTDLHAAEPPPETTRIRIQDAPITCFAPLYVAEALLKAEGFTEVEYVKTPLAEGGRTPAWPQATSTSRRTTRRRT